MGDVNSAGKTREIGEVEIVIRNKRTGKIKHQETIPVCEECDD